MLVELSKSKCLYAEPSTAASEIILGKSHPSGHSVLNVLRLSRVWECEHLWMHRLRHLRRGRGWRVGRCDKHTLYRNAILSDEPPRLCVRTWEWCNVLFFFLAETYTVYVCSQGLSHRGSLLCLVQADEKCLPFAAASYGCRHTHKHVHSITQLTNCCSPQNENFVAELHSYRWGQRFTA